MRFFLTVLLSLFLVIFLLNVTIADEVVLNCKSITTMSKTGVAIVDDSLASIKKAIEFQDGANNPLAPDPKVYFEMEFNANPGKYYIWLRVRSDGDTSTDSLWIQFDDEIGTDKGNRYPARGMGNWLDVFPAGEYVWASNEVIPPDGPTVESFTFDKGGKHILRTQPRQIPHRIDQIWLSTTQKDHPKNSTPVGGFAVKSNSKLVTIWGEIKTLQKDM
jgi:glucans biosynthesis protein C